MLALRLAAVRRVPNAAFVAVRHSSGDAGSVSKGSKAYASRERGQEDDYARRHEMEQLKKMKEKIESAKAELDKLQKEHEALEKQAKGGQ